MKLKLIVISALVTLMLPSCAKNDTNQLYQEIKSVDKMVLASMAITKTAKMDDDGPFYKKGKRIAVYSYDSYMRAYVDLSQLQMEDLAFDEDAKTVTVMLPPIMTEITGRDMDMRLEYDHIGWWRDSLNSKERAEVKEKANASFKKEVEENPMFKQQLTDAAKRKARKYFETIFDANGYTASIDFKPCNTEQK